MRKSTMMLTGACALAIACYTACSIGEKGAGTLTVDPTARSLFQPLPAVVESKTNAITEDKIVLGRILFYETRLSRSQQISCNSCHELKNYGVDGQPTSDGHKGLRGDRNSPTVYNAAGHFVQFWDGRAADVEEQARGPVLNPVEMAMKSEKEVVAVLKTIPEYVELFRKAFPEDKDPVTYENMAKAIGAFERKLLTPARWDRYLRGENDALTPEEKAGFNTYVGTGCQTCHLGTYVGGNLYQKLGLAKPWPDNSDPGRLKTTKNESDRLVFKVPSLRNVEKTGPYFHNGRVGTIDEAVANMAEFQLGKKLTGAEVKSIVVWLKSLTGELPAEYTKEPTLPRSTGNTPKADLSD